MKFCKSLPLVLAVIATTFASCGKMDMATPDTSPVNAGTPQQPGNNNDHSIKGTWSFAGAEQNTVSTAEISGMKNISYSYYTTSGNGGTVVIDDSNFRGTALTYTINGMIKTKVFMSALDSTEISVPYSVKIDPYTAESPYKRIGEDSIYLERGMVQSSVYGNSPVASTAAGGNISWRGDTLILTSTVNLAEDGIMTKGTAVLKLLKK